MVPPTPLPENAAFNLLPVYGIIKEKAAKNRWSKPVSGTYPPAGEPYPTPRDILHCNYPKTSNTLRISYVGHIARTVDLQLDNDSQKPIYN